MRQAKFVLIGLMVVTLCGIAFAGMKEFGVANSYQVSFVEKVWVGNTMLPQGDYQIRHLMEGQDHIMVFRQLNVRKPVEARAKCTLISLPAKAVNTEKVYTMNRANERVLSELIFKGDRAKHVF